MFLWSMFRKGIGAMIGATKHLFFFFSPQIGNSCARCNHDIHLAQKQNVISLTPLKSRLEVDACDSDNKEMTESDKGDMTDAANDVKMIDFAMCTQSFFSCDSEWQSSHLVHVLCAHQNDQIWSTCKSLIALDLLCNQILTA